MVEREGLSRSAINEATLREQPIANGFLRLCVPRTSSRSRSRRPGFARAAARSPSSISASVVFGDSSSSNARPGVHFSFHDADAWSSDELRAFSQETRVSPRLRSRRIGARPVRGPTCPETPPALFA